VAEGEDRIIVLVAGMPGSGKTVFSRVAYEMGIPVFTMGDVVREEAARRGLEPKPKVLTELAKKLREEHGLDVVAKRTLAKVEKSCSKVCVVDGVRSLVEVEVFRRAGKVVIVAVHASPATRFKRLRARGRPGDPTSWEDFRLRDSTELEFGLGDVIALADYVISNECIDYDEFVERSRLLLRSIIDRYKGETGAEQQMC
jgi:dephospho-CoA kinase